MKEVLNELALFAGAGGGILGGTLSGFKTVVAVEIDHYCQAVLLGRQADGILDPFPIWDDVQTFQGEPWRGVVDIVTAGFPCQPFSTAGKRQGENDERNMWPDTIRILREVRPEWALLENVPGLVTSGYFGTILRDLAQGGFNAEWGVFSAYGVGAPHLRERLWIVAHANGDWSGSAEHGIQQSSRPKKSNSGSPGNVVDPKGKRSMRTTGEVCHKNGGQEGNHPRILDQSGDVPHADSRKHKSGSSTKRGKATENLFSNSKGPGRPTRASQGKSGRCGSMGNSKGETKGRLSFGKKKKDSFIGKSGELRNTSKPGLQDGGGEQMGRSKQIEEFKRSSCEIPDTSEKSIERTTERRAKRQESNTFRTSWWTTEPGLGRVAHGVAHRVDRLKAIGNGQVPAVAARAFLELSRRFK